MGLYNPRPPWDLALSRDGTSNQPQFIICTHSGRTHGCSLTQINDSYTYKLFWAYSKRGLVRLGCYGIQGALMTRVGLPPSDFDVLRTEVPLADFQLRIWSDCRNLSHGHGWEDKRYKQ